MELDLYINPNTAELEDGEVAHNKGLLNFARAAQSFSALTCIEVDIVFLKQSMIDPMQMLRSAVVCCPMHYCCL